MTAYDLQDNWTAYEITTSDGYILNTFKISPPAEIPPQGSSILAMHGHSQDGTRWLTNYEDGLPFHINLVMEGYTVWIGNNRGTEYS